jgi:A/G-specific adenine glycosylase
MLQQTQVATVIPYYQRFMARFPDLSALANAGQGDVLAHWSGLGYYSRGRNLHRAAQVIRDEHGGRFPRKLDSIVALPGIGRSTAAAIVVFAYGGRHAILDGNVKRVLARTQGIRGFPGERSVAEALWHAANSLVPSDGVEGYTQGLMDLGATVCLRHNPKCSVCPVSGHCVALRDGVIHALPSPRPRKVLPHRSTVMLVFEHAGSLLLEKRPDVGIWGGLWCFPEVSKGDDIVAACEQRFGALIGHVQPLPDVEHGFTHFNLTISPQRLKVNELQCRAAQTQYQWLPLDKLDSAAIPAPVKRIAASL